MIDAILNERNNDEVIDELDACRSGANTIKPTKHRTGGILCCSTGSGFIVHLTENVHRETPTEVLIETVDAFTTKPSHIDYLERMEAIGYDNMCGLLSRIYSLGTKKLLTPEQAYFWHEMKCRAFVDSFHISTHKCKLCQKDSNFCVLHPKLPKFKKVLLHENNTNYRSKKREKNTRVNDEVKNKFS